MNRMTGSRQAVIIVCLRTADAAPRVVTPGSTTGRCSACGEEVWIAPSSMAAALAANGSVSPLCLLCYRKDGWRGTEEIAAGALDEVEAATGLKVTREEVLAMMERATQPGIGRKVRST